MKKIDRIIKYLLGILFALIALYLFLLSMFGTSVQQELSDGSLCNYFLDDQSWKHLIRFAMMVLVLVIISVKVDDKRISNIYRYVKLAVIFLTLVVGIVFIYKTQLYPASDPYKIYTIADQLLQGNKVGFVPSGYMYRYPDQCGFLLYCVIMKVVFRNSAYIAMQIMNLLFEVTIVWILLKTTELLWSNERVSLLSIFLIVSFLPLFFHITYLYGTIPGLCFSLMSLYFSCRGLKENKIWYYIVSSISIGLAVQFKTNSAIWFIGIILILFLVAIKRFIGHRTSWKSCAIGIFFMIISVFIFSKGVVCIIEKTCGVTVSQGMPKTTWIEMGLQDSESTPGSYNGYSVGLFEKNNYDYEATNKQAIKDIKKSLVVMKENPYDTASQFVRKVSWLWNNPTFQCIEMLKNRESSATGLEYDKGWFGSLLYGKLRYSLIDLLNCIQTLILGGTVSFIFLKRKLNSQELMSIIIVIGGFVFHIFWESKPQYVLPYFVLFIPLAAYGYVLLVNKIKMALVLVKGHRLKWKRIVPYIALVIILVLICMTPRLGKLVNVRSDDSRCEDYLEKKTADVVKYR